MKNKYTLLISRPSPTNEEPVLYLSHVKATSPTEAQHLAKKELVDTINESLKNNPKVWFPSEESDFTVLLTVKGHLDDLTPKVKPKRKSRRKPFLKNGRINLKYSP